MERRWLPPTARPKFELHEVEGRSTLDLALLAVRASNARCLLPGTDRELTLRLVDLWDRVPGEIVTVQVGKAWRYKRHVYVSGAIEQARLDVPALGLPPLTLADMGLWDPSQYDWGEVEGDPEAWAVPLLAKGARPWFEMEEVLPGEDPTNPDWDPILEAVDLKEMGAAGEACDLLMALLERDLRCLDAHAHLGNLEFEHDPQKALRHYEVGVRIGELTLGADFEGVLAWGMIRNRPFLRCLHGHGISLWRLGRLEEARRTFERLLWLNPPDNQGARFVLEDLRAGRSWEECSATEAADHGCR
jgi:tetratricopeptide (TPR) repeat protein